MTHRNKSKFNSGINFGLFIVFLVLFGVKGFGQLKIGMSPKAIMPSTVTASSSYSVIVWIKNKGNVSYTGKIHIKYGVDSTQTLTNIVETKYDSVNVTNFLPGDSVLKAFGETYDIPHAYRTDGNGSTVVMWPIVKGNPSATNDSLIRVVYVKKAITVGLNDFSELVIPIIYPNPTHGLVTLANNDINNQKLLKVTISSVSGNYTEDIYDQNNLLLSHLSNGIYILEFTYSNGLKSKPVRLVKN